MREKYPTTRSDIEKIINLKDDDFKTWYEERKNFAESALKGYKLIGTIPELNSSDERKMADYTQLSHHIEILEKSLTYLEILKDIREE